MQACMKTVVGRMWEEEVHKSSGATLRDRAEALINGWDDGLEEIAEALAVSLIIDGHVSSIPQKGSIQQPEGERAIDTVLAMIQADEGVSIIIGMMSVNMFKLGMSTGVILANKMREAEVCKKLIEADASDEEGK